MQRRYLFTGSLTCFLLFIASITATTWFLGPFFVRRALFGDRFDDFKSGATFDAGAPDIAPENDFVVFASSATGRGDIYRSSVDGTNAKRLTFTDDCELQPCISPDGQWIAYVRQSKYRSAIWVMKADGTNPRQVTSPLFYDDLMPSFSPDGSPVRFSRGPVTFNKLSNPPNLSEVSLESGKVTQLADRYGELSPDGALVARTNFDLVTSKNVITLEDRITGTSQELESGYCPVFSPDSEMIAFSRGYPDERAIWVASIKSGKARKVQSVVEYVGQCRFSRDGKTIVVHIGDEYGDGQVVGIDVQTGKTLWSVSTRPKSE